MSIEILKNVRILFVEDDDVQRNQLFTFLKRRVNKVYTAKNGEEGYEKYKTNKPDIILTDLRMPRVDGLELVRKIREENRLIPIVVATAMNDKETILKSIDVGITNYIVKPVDTDELLDVLIDSVKTILAFNNREFDSIVDKEKVNQLKNQLTKYIKVETGKGPSDIRITINQATCEVTLRDFLTVYEISLLKEEKNVQLVNHNRNVFFEDRKNILEDLLLTHFGLTYEMIEVKSNVRLNEVSITFKIN